MQSLKIILKRFAYSFKKEFLLGIFFNMLYSLFSVVSVVSIIPVLDMLLGTDTDRLKKMHELKEEAQNSSSFFQEIKYKAYIYLQDYIHEYGNQRVLAYLCLFVVIMFLFRNIFRYLAQYLIVMLRTGVSRKVRIALYDKILALPVSYFTERKKGDIMLRLSGDVNEVEGNILNAIIEIFRTPFAIIVTLISLFYISPKLTVIALLVLPIMAWIISVIGKSLKKDARRGLAESGQILSQIDETLNGSKVIKIFNAEHTMKQRFTHSANLLKRLSARVMYKYELASPSSEFLGSVAMIFITWYGGILILEGNGELDLTSFLGYIGLFFQLLEPAKTFSNSISNMHKGTASTDRIMEVLDADNEIEQKENAFSIESLQDKIEFKNISFSYEPDHKIINNISFTIKKGSTVALVGQSGSGKTTLANLITRFYDVTEGEILIDNHNIKDLNLTNYRKLMGMVTQESVLFNDTIFNNIRLSNPNATLEEVKQAAKVANALDFINDLPDGFNTIIGESGNKLSGGQKQRLSIARAVLKNPPIMILDEATSALDTESEKLVQNALENLMSNRTSLVIAHRLSTIQNADLIIVMERGKIMEQGKHSELMENNGIYRKLIEMQSFS